MSLDFELILEEKSMLFKSFLEPVWCFSQKLSRAGLVLLQKKSNPNIQALLPLCGVSKSLSHTHVNQILFLPLSAPSV